MTEAHTPTNHPSAAQEESRRIRTVWINGVVGIAFVIIGAIIITQTPRLTTWEAFLQTIPVALALISFLSAWLAWRRYTTAAGAILLTVLLFTALTIPVIGKGQGLAVGVLVAILGIGITATTLPPKYSTAGNTASLLVGAVVIALDQVMPDFGLPSVPIYSNIFALVLSTIFIAIIIRQFNTFTLRAKLVLSFATITIIPLVVLGVYNQYTASQTLTRESREKLTALSLVTRERIDSYFIEQQDIIRTEAKQVALVDYLLLPPTQRAGSVEEQKAELTLLAFQRKDSVFIDSYSLLDVNGKSVLSTSSEDAGRDESDQPYFVEVITTGAPYISNVLFIEEDEASIYVSAAVKDPGNRIIGIIRAEYHATILQSLARSVQPDNKNLLISVVDRNTYLRLAYTGNRDLLFKSYKGFSEGELASMQQQGFMPPGSADKVLAGVDEKITTGIDQIEITPFFDAYSGSLGSDTINTGVYLTTQPWVALVRESYQSNRSAIADQTSNIILLSLALAGGAILLALAGAQVLASPLVSLAKVAESITAGDINARAEIYTQDEIGMLAASFNHMTDELNLTLNSLEERVSERTLDLESAQKQTEKRANELEAISEISKIITGEQKLEILLPLITRLVSERFGFYHTGIFLIEETRQFAVLQAANSEGGRRMLARTHRLQVGYGIVGYVAKAGIHRIALDVGTDSVYFNNPDLPTTRSEMALPLKIRGRVIGVLDVQSELSNAYTENDAKNLSILADQIAIALENAQLFERTQQALNEAQMLYRQNIQEGWASFRREGDMIGYRQTVKGGQALKEPIESDEIREVINRGSSIYLNTDGGAESYIIVPVKLRGQVIGTLDIKAPTKDRQWTNDEINFVESISERLSIALENARLIQESQRQVVKQQTIRDVTEKISASINLKNVLQSAVEELGRVMPGSEVILKMSQRDTHAEQE